MAEDQSPDDRFVVFSRPKWGIRAIARILITYQDKRQAKDGSAIDSVTEVIERWAPPHENNTTGYAKFVAENINMAVDDESLDVYNYQTMKGLVKSIITMENGAQPYDDKVIDAGLRLAGIDVPAKELRKSRTIKAGTAATATTTITAILSQIDLASAMLEPMAEFIEPAKYILIGLTVISIGVMMWARIDDSQNESRA
jgi:tetrahydrodipicolinate N-succinyltransferase